MKDEKNLESSRSVISFFFFFKKIREKSGEGGVTKTKAGDKDGPMTQSDMSFTAALPFPFYREDN